MGPMPSRTLPVARRLRLVGLVAGVEISTVAPSHRNDSGTR